MVRFVTLEYFHFELSIFQVPGWNVTHILVKSDHFYLFSLMQIRFVLNGRMTRSELARCRPGLITHNRNEKERLTESLN